MSVKKGVAITAIGTFVPPAVMLLTQIVLAHSLGVEGRGTVAAATAPLTLAVVFLCLGLPEALTYMVARDGGKLLTRQLVLSLIALGFTGLAGTWLLAAISQPLSAGSSELADLMTFAAAALVPGLLTGALRGVALGARHWWLIAAERSSNAILQLIAVCALFASGMLTPETATLVISVTTFFGGLVYLASPRWWATLGAPTSSTVLEPAMGLVAFSWRCWVGSMAGIFLARADQVMMTPLAGVEELGIYVVGANVSMVALLANAAVTQVMFATESGDPNSSRVGRAARITTILTGLLGSGLIACSYWMVPLLFGQDFSRAVPVAVILIIEICLAIPGSVAGATLNARGRPGLRSLSLAVGAVAYFASMIILVPRYGAIGAAFAMAAGTILPGYLAILLLKRYCDVGVSEFFRFRKSDFYTLMTLVRRSY